MTDRRLMEALGAYVEGDVAKALRTWRDLVREEGGDRVAKRYLDHLRSRHPEVWSRLGDDRWLAEGPAPRDAPPEGPWDGGPTIGDAEHVSGTGCLWDRADVGRGRDEEVERLEAQLEEALALDDLGRGLRLARRILERAPAHVRALEAEERCRRELETMALAKIGNLNARPRVVMSLDEVIWLGLDHRAGFLLAQMDGEASVDDLVSVSGFERLEVLEIIAHLLDQGVIRLVEPPPSS